MASGNELISQSYGNVLQTTTPSDRRNQISNECYVRRMIVLVLLLLHNTREDRITTVKDGAEHSVNTVTATLPKTRHLPMGHRVPKMTLVPGLMAPTRLAQASQRKSANGKATTPFKQDRLPLVKRVHTNQVLTKLQGFKRRDWPKLKRLSRVIHRTSRRVLLFRAQLSVLQSELEDRTSSGNSSIKTTMCKQKPTELEFIPDRLYQVGLFFIQHYLQKWNARSVDGKLGDIPELAALLID
ncbi:uncharacterized protein N7529_000959 [Penicillium soppii]|uniref:uncharacterized protein n=1 Tax=Penicillium soppii TaxID=69789 RepID=UPI0025488453|nr:uncharacterized protein N7529_000959 [Penicillium soppii]KAJ5882287.1 hypothetical protein N7529_000959 [Penicillium soppii]